MSIYVGSQKAVLYKGDYHPASLYRGSNKIAGYKPLELSGTALAFADTYNDTVQALTVYGKSTQVQTTQGKNLFDKNKTVAGKYIDQTNGVLTVNANYSASGYIPITGGASYAISVNDSYIYGAFYSSSKAYISGLTKPQTTWVAPSNAAFMRISCRTAYIDSLQLELGSTATTYAPFVPNSPSPDYPSPIASVTGNLNITDGTDIKQTLALADLNGLPAAGVYDTDEPRLLDDGVWRRRKTQRIGKKVLDGTTLGAKFDLKNADEGDYKSFYMVNAYLGRKDLQIQVICSHFANAEWPPPAGNYWWWATASTGMRIHKSYLTNYENLTTDSQRIAAANAWLAAQYAAGTPVTVYYALATPVVTLGAPVVIPTYPGQTIISAPAQITASARVRI